MAVSDFPRVIGALTSAAVTGAQRQQPDREAGEKAQDRASAWNRRRAARRARRKIRRIGRKRAAGEEKGRLIDIRI